MDKMLLAILVGSIRQGRKSLAVAEAILEKVRESQAAEAELIDLAEFGLPLLEERTDEAEALPAVQDLCRRLRAADGLVIVAPEYKGGVPGALKNALDYLPPGFLRRKPVGICTVSAGGYGGINCLAQLRLNCLALGGLPIPDYVAVSRVNQSFDEGGRLLDPAFPAKVEAFLRELLWYCKALAAPALDRPELETAGRA